MAKSIGFVLRRWNILAFVQSILLIVLMTECGLAPQPINGNPPTSSTTITPTFDFEQGTQGWTVSLSGATISLTNSPVYSGRHALKVLTKLSASNAPRTDVIGSLSGNPGFPSPGPYNLLGKRVSCQVFLPHGLDAKADPRAQVKLFVQSQQGGLNLGTPTIIKSDLVDRWITIFLDVGASQKDTTYNFHATSIVQVGVRLETRTGSLVTYSGPFFIDDCRIT